MDASPLHHRSTTSRSTPAQRASCQSGSSSIRCPSQSIRSHFLFLALLAQAQAHDVSMYNVSSAGSCNLDAPGATYTGSNLYPFSATNTTATAAGCCVLCQSTKACAFWTWTPSCPGRATGVDCCYLKTAMTARKTGTMGAVSGARDGRPLPGATYKCIHTQCVKTGPANGTAYSSASCDGACGASTLTSLAPLKMQMLAIGAVQPTGWLQNQLTTQVNGLAGHLERFWPDVMNTSWIKSPPDWKETYSDRGGNFPYWLNGVIPLTMQTRSLSDNVDKTGYNLTRVVVDSMRKLVAAQKAAVPGTWMAPGSWNLGTWNTVRSCILLMSAVPAETALLLPFVLTYIEFSQARLKAEGWPISGTTMCTDEWGAKFVGGGVCRFRYPDWMHILQQLLDAHGEKMTEAERATVFAHMELVGWWGFDFRAFYAEPCATNVSVRSCLPTSGCNTPHVADHDGCTIPAWFKTFPQDIAAVHGVHGGAMPLKEGTVRWRMTQRQEDLDLDERKVEMLERYQGQPTGQFSADEQMAGREARRGTELCTIVETMYSLGAMGQNGVVKFMDRLERIAFNALPAALTADMWSHVYLSMINEVQAAMATKYQWGLYGTTGQNATTYGLADRFTGITPCCTANHNQGWPKLTQFAVQVDLRPSSKAIYVVLLLPVNVTLPPSIGGGASVSVETEYPFGDAVTVRVRATEAVTLHMRVPTWATHATASLNGAAHAKVDGGAYHTVQCSAGGETVLTLALNPDIVVERHWGLPGVNGVAVTRGPLLFALPMDETVAKMGSPYDQCFESGCSQDVQITSTQPWAYVLQLPDDGGAKNSSVVNPKGWTFSKLGSPGKHPFAGNAALTVAITAEARVLSSWTMDAKFTATPQTVPVSPVDCSTQCGPVKTIQLVPYGSTRLRMGMLPYTTAKARLRSQQQADQENTLVGQRKDAL